MFERQRKIPLFRMAWRNAQRHIRRTLLTASSVMVAVAAGIMALAWVGGIMDDALDTYAKTESGHVRIRKEGYTEREQFMPMHLHLSNLSELLPVVRAQPMVAAALPRIRMSVLVDGAASNRPALVLGLDLDGEADYYDPAAMMAHGTLPRPGHAEVMLGKGLAERLEVGIGDTVTLLGQTAYRSLGGLRLAVSALAVSGVGAIDNSIMFAPLDQAQNLADMQDATTEIVVFAEDSDQADLLADELRASLGAVVPGGLEVLSWRDQAPLVRTLQTAQSVFGLVLLLLLGMASLIIVNTMLMTVMECTQEFGVQAAMGMRSGDIVLSIVAEGLVIGLAGAVVGGLLGSGTAVFFEFRGFDFTEAMSANIDFPISNIIYPDWKAIHTVVCVALGALTGGLATLYPARRAVKMKPAEALRA